MGRGDLATLVRICDLAGRPRGTGFVADDRGTVVTSHEAVDGLVRIVLHAADERMCLAEADAITALPEAGLALVRTEGLGVRPLPLSARTEIEAGTYVRIAAHGWREARVLGGASVTYTATDRFHVLGHALELAIGTEGAEALRLGGQAAGGPVVDPATGAVVGVLGTALQGDHREAAGYAVPLAPVEPLVALLRRNGATVPCYGRDLNLAGVLELTATSTGSAGGPKTWTEPVERAACVREFSAFSAGDAVVLALVGTPGTGRTTALAAHCADRARGAEPAPTVWLRGADLHAEDTSVAEAVARVLRQAGRIVAATGARGDATTATPERAAALAREAGRPLLVILDGPEEMPPILAHRLPGWTAGTETWLRAHGARLMLGCRPEHWEQASGLYAPESLHRRKAAGGPDPGEAGREAAGGPDPGEAGAVPLGELAEEEAALAQARYGLRGADLGVEDARHPLALRLLAEVCEAMPGGVPGRPGREEIFGAYLDLMCLRIAVRIAAGSRPLPSGTAVRRLAARVAGQVHEAARRCLGPGQGELDRESFEEIFPWRTGWASAVLTEGLVVPAGAGYRFGHEELADWIQGAHLDVDGALHALVHRWHEGAPVRLPSRPGAPRAMPTGHVPPPPGAHGTGGDRSRSLPVPRHRIGPVVQALLLLDREQGPAALGRRLMGLSDALDRLSDAGGAGTDAAWWGSQLLVQTLQRLPDLKPYLPVLRHLADHIGAGPATRPQPVGLAALIPPPPDLPGADGGGARPAPGGAGVGRGGLPGADHGTGPRPVPSAVFGPVGPEPLPSAAFGPVGPEPLPRLGVPGADPGTIPGRWPSARLDPGPGPGYEHGLPAAPTDGRGSAPAPRSETGSGRRPAPMPAAGAVPVQRAPAPFGPSDQPVGRQPAPMPAAGAVPVQRAGGASGPLASEWSGEAAPGSRPVPGASSAAPRLGAFSAFGLPFWDALRIGWDERMDLLRRLVPVDAAPGADATPRFLDAVAARLVAEPRGVQPLLCRWFGDGRALAAAPHATVATAAQALLHTHRNLAVDDLCEALVATAHPLAEGLLAALAEDEPSAVCRAVDRWAHDDGRPGRRAAAAAYGCLVAEHVTTGPDRELLRYTALALLARPGDADLHGSALGLLVRDPHTRARHLPRALTDPRVPANALAAALTTHPEPVLAAFRARLHGPEETAGEALRALAEVTTPSLARRAAALVREYVEHRPSDSAVAGHAAAFVDRSLEHGPAARAILFPLVSGLLLGRPVQVRRALAPVLAAPGTGASRLLRTELLDILLDHERYESRDLTVLDALLRAAALECGRRTEVRTRDLVHRVGLLLVRTPEGATRLDRRLVELAREVPAFAAQLSGWLTAAPDEWATVVGPSTRRTVLRLGSSMPMRGDGRGHGSLRPA
ncbi:trypsin-like peptidase domain-containing protein [Streptomyces sp. NPDC046712]|uniref:trypsin-like peptidase domain-containing protein n=1 Tax=Streptomyces sp. NPDC046712 TaxID=3154802 RepID=UPI0034068CD8